MILTVSEAWRVCHTTLLTALFREVTGAVMRIEVMITTISKKSGSWRGVLAVIFCLEGFVGICVDDADMKILPELPRKSA